MDTDQTWQDLLRLASRLEAEGRIAEAIAAYGRLLAIRPDLADSWYNLGYLQRWAGRFEEALASYAEALKRGASGPEEIHLNRGVIYADHLRRPEEAEAELRSALAIDADYVPALLNLGNLHEDRGERAEARAVYERVLAIEPGNALALTRLAGVIDIAGPADPMIARLKGAFSRPGLDPADRADLGFALGQVLDAAGAYDEAFAAYAGANEASRLGAGPAGARYDRAAHEMLIDRLIRAFPVSAASAEASADPPLFICGLFRSGSTLAEQILASHSGVSAGGELDILPSLAAALRPYPEAAAGASSETIGRLRDAYLERLKAIHSGGGLVTDKRPDNFVHIGLIKTLFPNAKIVHTRRDPLDNLLSLWFLHLDHGMPYALDLMDAAHWYRQYRRLMAHWKRLYPEDIYDLDYEALVAEPEPTIRRLLDFIGLPWEESCLSFHKARNAVRTASVWQVRRPIYRRSAGRWRNYERHLAPLRAALADWGLLADGET